MKASTGDFGWRFPFTESDQSEGSDPIQDPGGKETFQGRKRECVGISTIGFKTHGTWRAFSPGLPARKRLPVQILSVGVSEADEITEVIAHLAGQIIVPAVKGTPAFGQRFKPEPKIRGVEGSGMVPAGNLRIKNIAIAGLSGFFFFG